MRMQQASRTVLVVTALFLALVNAGCNGAQPSNNNANVAGPGSAASPHPDWGMSLLAGGGVGAGQYPAKFTFDVTDCSELSERFHCF